MTDLDLLQLIFLYYSSQDLTFYFTVPNVIRFKDNSVITEHFVELNIKTNKKNVFNRLLVCRRFGKGAPKEDRAVGNC